MTICIFTERMNLLNNSEHNKADHQGTGRETARR